MAKFKLGQRVIAWVGNQGIFGTIQIVWDDWDGKRAQLYDVKSDEESSNHVLVGVFEEDIEEREPF